MRNGFSLVELLIAAAVMAILLSVAMPAFQEMIATGRVRSTAELFNQGLQLARSEAIKRNNRVFFSFSGAGWTVGCEAADADCPATIQVKPATEGGQSVNILANPAGATKVTFTSLGRLFVDNAGDMNNPDGSAEFDSLAFSAPATARSFSLLIRPTGNAKFCDSQAAAGSPMEC